MRVTDVSDGIMLFIHTSNTTGTIARPISSDKRKYQF